MNVLQVLAGMVGGLILIPGMSMPISLAQVLGEMAEMKRLEQRADEAIAQADPEGAALAMGKAAFMAALIARKEEDSTVRRLHQAVEILFRGQEQGYRALALFERAGGQTPASQGVCQFLVQAGEKVKKFQEEIESIQDISNVSVRDESQRHIARGEEWEELLRGFQQDFLCER